MRIIVFFLLFLVGFFGNGCVDSSPTSFIVATTTSTRDTGLFEELLPVFQAKTGIEPRVVAVGTGQALEIGRRGDADVLLTHDPDGEQRFVAEGFGTSRMLVMSNDFVLVGPVDDPAGVGGATSGADAFLRIARKQAVFVSRGDESGTHRKEKATWALAGLEPSGDWYVRSGQGMGAVLRMADEKRGYTLSDKGTFLAQRDKLSLAVVYTGDPTWTNQYAVVPVNPARHPHVKHDLAERFAEFLVSDEGQRLIAEFGRAKYGEPLFRANSPRAGGGP
ncbi:ABC-type tungstate transport system, permease component [Isosphaera pallida ATCC 43644]|uniref:ABC-type tungstate transport system, permease component n=1 Tax=Isosphaera pallida (strain ATCC 43644 / DSM 9630 / IS1B) TaxID=575540 RepID=E8QYM4_ISOPI|nr:ABC-type tungstate transport system, permease component [Isosphaera pallida ATCC 43644]